MKSTRAIFASGCFWGTQHSLQTIAGVLSTTAGYTGGQLENPSYFAVCGGATGHAEAVEVIFDADVLSYEDLAKAFFEMHNPGHKVRPGRDIGSQYRSAVFYVDAEQKEIAERLVATLKERGYAVATEVTEATTFWKAEERHQDYYSKHGRARDDDRREKKF